MLPLTRCRLITVGSVAVLLAAAALSTLPLVRTSAVAFPIAITGTARINNATAPGSSVITVAISGGTCATTPPVVRPDANGNWALVLEFRDACTEAGPTTFFINGRFAAGPFATTPRGPVALNLPHGARVTVPQLSRD